jgi:glycine dehydrogenase subunit 1
MDFIPQNMAHIQQMLAKIGCKSLDDLYRDVPADLQIKKLNLPDGLSEADLLRRMQEMANKNGQYRATFLGAGCYYHYIPSIVDAIISRSEFYTAYTPYQAEVSQGLLQAIYEYQTAIARLTGMDVANASMYDGASALAEAAIMAVNNANLPYIILVDGIHPEYIETVKTYCWGRNINVESVPPAQLGEKLTPDVGGVLFQSPNFFGELGDVPALVREVRTKAPKALVVQCMTDPTCLGLLTPPGSQDIDVFVAEGQALGISPSFGGPGLGIFTAKNKLVRKMPGRLIGRTKEVNGSKEGFVLTLQAREQHIRRDKALSNICSNQALCMLMAVVYLAAQGKMGLQEVATQNFRKAAYVRTQLAAIPGVTILSQPLCYNEFVFAVPDAKKVVDACQAESFLPPLQLDRYFPDRKNQLLVCITEINTKAHLEKFISLVKQACGGI